MADLERFRSDVASWLDHNAPAELVGTGPGSPLDGNWGGRRAKFASPAMKQWLEVAAAKGYTAPTWPREYGGGGLEAAEAKVLAQELRKRKLPAPLIGFGLTMIGPTLLQYGNEEQKREHLPPVCRGEIRWCQGYSEPDSGSDLASLKTKAVRDGDHFVVTGQKVWTSYADQADWMFCLVRTSSEGRKQEGITFLLLDMASPGVSVKPILLISGSSPFCETFLEEVRVPVRNVVSEIGSGWTVAKALLGHERSMIADAFGTGGGDSSRKRVTLADWARRYIDSDDSGRLADSSLRSELADFEMEQRAFLLTVQRTRDAAKAGHQPGAESSIFKIGGTELNQRRHELRVSMAGAQALGWEGPGFDDEELALTRDWLRSRGNTIEGGTSEVQLNIIAKHVLGLPD